MPKETTHIKTISLSDLPIWEQAQEDRTLLNVTLELTARCNNNCSQCYINVPASDKVAQSRELSFEQIKKIVDEAVSLGALWFLISGGEPLLRPDFSKIYTYMKKKGLLVSVFTNASLINQDHIDLFKKYPPRDIEVTVYGVTQKTHKKVTGKNTFSATMAGIDHLFSNSLPVTLKSMITRSNMDEINQIAHFCRSKTNKPFRFDASLHLRLDRDPEKNFKITSQRLTPNEIFEIERNESERVKSLSQKCKNLNQQSSSKIPNKLFRCMAGINSCGIDYTGNVKPCTSLCNDKSFYDLKNGSLKEAWDHFIPTVIQQESDNKQFLTTCGNCNLHNICSWCPAHADLETGSLDGHTPYFCSAAKQRKKLTQIIY